MHAGWNPSDHLADMAKQAMTQITPAIQQEFIAHWLTDPNRKHTQAEWDKKLLQSAQHRKAKNQSKPKMPSPENFEQRNYGKGVQSL